METRQSHLKKKITSEMKHHIHRPVNVINKKKKKNHTIELFSRAMKNQLRVKITESGDLKEITRGKNTTSKKVQKSNG